MAINDCLIIAELNFQARFIHSLVSGRRSLKVTLLINYDETDSLLFTQDCSIL